MSRARLLLWIGCAVVFGGVAARLGWVGIVGALVIIAAFWINAYIAIKRANPPSPRGRG